MTLHAGKAYQKAGVSIESPNLEEIRRAVISDDILEEVETGLAWALNDPNVYYFSIRWQEQLVGQIYLHDINWESSEGMVGYHLFRNVYHSRGIGTKALSLLLQFCLDDAELSKLVIITGAKNLASQRIAEKCGFSCIGIAREDPNNIVYEYERG